MSFPIFTVLSCLAEDVLVRRHSYSSVIADLTTLKHLSYIQNLDDEEDDTGATGVSALDTSWLGLWLSDLLVVVCFILDLSCLVLSYLVLS